jgi:hypothetical protein
MGTEVASILYPERNQDVVTSVDINNGMSGGHVGAEFAVFRLLSGIAWYRSHMWKGNVSIDGGDRRIDDKVLALRKKNPGRPRLHA